MVWRSQLRRIGLLAVRIPLGRIELIKSCSLSECYRVKPKGLGIDLILFCKLKLKDFTLISLNIYLKIRRSQLAINPNLCVNYRFYNDTRLEKGFKL